MSDPADVVRSVADGVCRLFRRELTPTERDAQLDALAACYAERTDVRHPFAPLGDTVLRTRADLRHHFAQARPDGVERHDVTDAHVHRTDDPEVVIFEFHYSGTMNGRDFSLPAIFVVRVRDGEIVESRDYADHVGRARASGGLPALAEALTERQDASA